jgi:uncharacterized protein (DUF433 family)
LGRGIGLSAKDGLEGTGLLEYLSGNELTKSLERRKTQNMSLSLDHHIVTTPGIAGGRPRIKGHRIRVQDIMVWHERLGRSADEIAAEYDLSLGDVYAALAYYYDHREELEEDMRDDEEFLSEQRRRIPSRLRDCTDA